MVRYRLRFLLQEFDLPRGETILGRSADCHVTIEDPLVSRQHARIVFEGDQPVISDLGSRNGVKVNGAAIAGAVALSDGDRIRIGTQELVFCKVSVQPRTSGKTTGFLRHCASCRLPYAQEAGACPSCGSTELLDEQTLSGQFGSTARSAWTLRLLVEVAERALALGKTDELERVLSRSRTQVEEILEDAGDALDAESFSRLAMVALRHAEVSGDTEWGRWAMRVMVRASVAPPPEVVDACVALSSAHPAATAEAVGELAAAVHRLAEGGEAQAAEAWKRLEQTLGQHAGAHSSRGATTS